MWKHSFSSAQPVSYNTACPVSAKKGSLMKKEDVLREALREIGRLGGEASAKALTAQQRTERARKAGKARQAKARKERRGK
jgi:hypothetical protein